MAVFCTCDSGKIKRKLLGNFLPVSFLTAKKVTDPDLATIAHIGKLVKYLGAIFAPSPLQ